VAKTFKSTFKLSLVPFPPVRRTNVDWLPGLNADPAIGRAAARECQGVPAIVIDHGELQVTIKRRGSDGLPLHRTSLGHSLTLIRIESRQPTAATGKRP
jgi:hypothetical protein